MPKLTKSLLSTLQAPARGSSFVWDSLLPGFGVRTLPSGRSSYVVRYRTGTRTDRHENAAAASGKILGFAIDATRQSRKSDGV